MCYRIRVPLVLHHRVWQLIVVCRCVTLCPGVRGVSAMMLSGVWPSADWSSAQRSNRTINTQTAADWLTGFTATGGCGWPLNIYLPLSTRLAMDSHKPNIPHHFNHNFLSLSNFNTFSALKKQSLSMMRWKYIATQNDKSHGPICTVVGTDGSVPVMLLPASPVRILWCGPIHGSLCPLRMRRPWEALVCNVIMCKVVNSLKCVCNR